MNILIYSYTHLGFNSGGLQNQILYTKNSLIRSGFNIIELNEWFKDRSIKIHVAHQFSLHPSLISTFLEFKKLGIPVIISTVFNLSSNYYYKIFSKLSKFNFPFLYFRDIRRMLIECNDIVVLGNSEGLYLNSNFLLNKAFKVVPNGIPDFLLNFDFDKDINYKTQYVISIGKICENKNQLNLIKACKNLGIGLKLLGEYNVLDPYFIECRKNSYEGVEFLGFVSNDSPEFVNLVSSASCFALVSKKEVFPISALESISLQTPVVLTQNSFLFDYDHFSKVSFACNPKSINSIKNSINNALNMVIDKQTSLSFKEYFNWDNVSKKLSKIYSKYE